MPQRELIPSSWAVDPSHNGDTDGASVHLRCKDQNLPFDFTFEPVRPNVFRTRFTSESHPPPPRPSVPHAPVQLDGVNPAVISSEQSKEIQIGNASAKVDWSGSTPVVSISLRGSKDGPLHQDVPDRSYAVDGSGVAHYTRYRRGTLHVGLGEKSAPMDLSGRRFTLSAMDCFGYDVHRSDPLYKHIPLLINASPQGCVAMFSTSHVRGEYSVGSEMDGMWGYYKVYRQDYGGLEEYLIIGTTLKEVVRTYADLAGYPLLVPRWALGYLSGGMKYSVLDDPRACDALMELARKMKEHDIPCSAYQLSSGYTISETPPKNRHVFTWNRHRFPDPEGFVRAYRQMGLRLIANIKPYVLASHPAYPALAAAGALFTDPRTGRSAVTRLWSAGGGESGDGGHIDFTSAAGYRWWFDGVKKLREQGIECMWNDNNEYTVPDDEWICRLDEPSLLADGARSSSNSNSNSNSKPQIGVWGRSLQTELNGRSSHDALLEAAPDERPFVLTRSATAGTLRWACSSWSGDNVTSWAGMRGANALSLTAGMCLMQSYGHDIGGFEGPQPGPELLVRWVQQGVYSPRFAINCFKTGNDNSVGDVIEPWMYPSVTPLVRKAIKRRYALIPYLYSLALVGHRTAEPPQRWTGWGYETDSEVWTKPITDGETQYWLGDALLVGGVFEPGESKARVYLPKASEADEGFLNVNAPYQHLVAGQWAIIDAEWHGAGIPVLAKVGSAVPVGKDVQVLSAGEKTNPAGLPLDDYRAVEIYPPPADQASTGKWYETVWCEDDGISPASKNRISEYGISYSADADDIKVKFTKDESSGFKAPWISLVVILPVGDTRSVISSVEGVKISDLGTDTRGRKQFELN